MEIIAEIGQNHNGDLGLARELIRAARENGADVAKFQVYEACELFPREGNPWYDYNCRTELSRDHVLALAQECAQVGIEFMASVFDVERVAWLEEAGVKRYKIASRSIRETDLIAAIAATGKPVLASLGMWDGPDFPALDIPGGVGYLYCLAKYPAPLKELHLGSVDFGRYAGFSDHSVGLAAALAACALGAGILEKHFTLDKAMYGPDHEGSMTPDELGRISRLAREIRAAL